MKILAEKFFVFAKRAVFIQRCFVTTSPLALTQLQNFCVDLRQRQLIANSHPPNIYECDGLKKLSELPNVLYAGFDATADSLHVGNLCIINSLFRAVLCGCKVILLIGKTTALAGDPSGRSSARNISTDDVISANAVKIQKQLETITANFIDRYGKKYSEEIVLVCNNDWYDKMSIGEFLHIGHSFHIGNMLRLSSIKKRMHAEGRIDFSEFSYQNLQAIDWLHLAKTYNCFFQIGGSDQLGNFDVGYNYIRDTIGKSSAALGIVLVTNSSGDKLGKSVTDPSASVWLNSSRTSPYAFFQFWRQQPDKEIKSLISYVTEYRIVKYNVKYMSFFHLQFSLQPLQEVNAVLSNHEANLGRWIAQEYLANEMTQLVHGKHGLDLAQRCTKALFHGTLEELKNYSLDVLKSLFGRGSTHIVHKAEVKTIGNLADKIKTGRPVGTAVVKSGGFKLNGKRYNDPELLINFDDVFFGGKCITIVTWGKRNHQLIVWVD